MVLPGFVWEFNSCVHPCLAVTGIAWEVHQRLAADWQPADCDPAGQEGSARCTACHAVSGQVHGHDWRQAEDVPCIGGCRASGQSGSIQPAAIHNQAAERSEIPPPLARVRAQRSRQPLMHYSGSRSMRLAVNAALPNAAAARAALEQALAAYRTTHAGI